MRSRRRGSCGQRKTCLRNRSIFGDGALLPVSPREPSPDKIVDRVRSDHEMPAGAKRSDERPGTRDRGLVHADIVVLLPAAARCPVVMAARINAPRPDEQRHGSGRRSWARRG